MISVFLSYAHADEAYRRQLEKHLASLRRESLIAPWHDRKIVPGEDIDQEIDANLERADIILLLVSPDFIESELLRHRDEAGGREAPDGVRACHPGDRASL